jgi:geranylgeranyl reductase family protein
VPTHYDVVIVGAGPAGSTAALSILAHAPHLSVALVDRDTFPRDKSCGDGLGPGVRHILRTLDAMEVVADAPSPPAVRVGGPGGWEGYAEGPTVKGKDLSGFVIPRKTLDARLAWLARDRGATLLEGLKFSSSHVESDRRVISFKRGGETVELTARILVGADGAYSRVRRDLGLGRAPDKFTHIAMRAYAPVKYDDLAEGDLLPLRLDFEEEVLPAYGWVFPTSTNHANVGVGMPLTILKQRGISLGDLLDSYVEKLEDRGIKVGEMEARLSHHLPHAAQMPTMTHDRAVLIGDAASMINSISGEGIVYGMIAGLTLGEQLKEASGESSDNLLLGAFEKQFKRRFRHHFWSCWTSHRLLRSPTWARAVIKAASRNEHVMADAAFLLFDEQRLKLSTGLRILRSGVLPGRR